MAFSRGPNIVTDGLVLALDAANTKSYPGTGSIWYDLSGNELHATLYNGPTYESDNQGVILFDGVDDYAQVPASPITAINVFTFELWINRTGIATFTGPYDRIFQKDGGYSGYPAWGFHLGEGTPAAPSFRSAYSPAISDYNNSVGFTTNAVMEFGEWHYYAASIDSSLNLKLYHNGTLDNTGLLDEPPMATEDSISIAIGDSREFYGKIPIVRVYNRVMNSMEILQNYLATKSRFGL